MVVIRNDTMTPSKPPLKTLTYQQSWEQIAQDRAKWRGLIGSGAGEYEAKRISEAEQKSAQRRARAKVSPTELSSSNFSCPATGSLDLRLYVYISSSNDKNKGNNDKLLYLEHCCMICMSCSKGNIAKDPNWCRYCHTKPSKVRQVQVDLISRL